MTDQTQDADSSVLSIDAADTAPLDDRRYGLLEKGLAEAQMSVRAYDTKAQIVGVGYVFALGIVARFEDAYAKDAEEFRVVLSWLLVIVPIVLFGMVIYPSRKSVERSISQSRQDSQRILFLQDDELTPESVEQRLAGANASREIVAEYIVVSRLRNLKRMRFSRAMICAGISFSLIFLSQIYRGL